MKTYIVRASELTCLDASFAYQQHMFCVKMKILNLCPFLSRAMMPRSAYAFIFPLILATVT